MNNQETLKKIESLKMAFNNEIDAMTRRFEAHIDSMTALINATKDTAELPKTGSKYWYITDIESCVSVTFDNCVIDQFYMANRNFFSTETEAHERIKEIKLDHEIRSFILNECRNTYPEVTDFIIIKIAGQLYDYLVRKQEPSCLSFIAKNVIAKFDTDKIKSWLKTL